jgi:LuxR family maltose regulon positive regulatory protein
MPLLHTKLYIPPHRSELVPRLQLVERLNEGIKAKLTLVSAPAGFGKTTLLSEWANQAQPPKVAWLSLDKGDNDPARFLAYLVAALQRVEESIGAGVLSALQLPQPPSAEELLTTLINQINASAASALALAQAHPESSLRHSDNGRSVLNFVLVIDDYHVIAAPPIHKALNFLLEHMPANMHLIIATRADPPLHLARLRGCGQLNELRAPDLRFTLEEAMAFFNTVMKLDLSPEEVAALSARTEGWIASLQMAAISMLGRKRTQDAHDVSAFVKAFAGSHRFILDYLMEEVLDQQSPAIQEFLIKTSILERLTAPLCEAVLSPVSDRPPQAILEYLESSNLFIVPLDDERRWYRYHHLFSDLLQQRLQQQVGEQDLAILHRQASRWYEDNGLINGAIEHALAAKDFERAAQLIEGAAEATWMRKGAATILNWVEALPDDLLRIRPLLCVYHALALLMSGRPVEAVESRLQDALAAGGAGSVAGEIALVRALIATYRGDTHQGAELSHRALELLPEESLFLRSLIAGLLGLNYMYRGDVVAATEALEAASRLGQQVGNLVNAVLALSHLAELCIVQGQLYEARAYYTQALDLAVDDKGRKWPVYGVALMGLGELLREWNDLEASARNFTEGIELVREFGDIWAISGYTALARVKQEQGDVEAAHEAIHAARQMAIRFDATEMDDIRVAAYQALLWISQGDIEAASRWAETRGLEAAVGVSESEGVEGKTRQPFLDEFEYITLARLYIAQRRPDEALALLEPLLQRVETAGWVIFVIDILVLQSLAHQARGDVESALVTLERALSLAEPEGFVRTFVDEGEPMARLLRKAVSKGITPTYASKLLGVLDVQSKDKRSWTQEVLLSPVARHPQEALVEPLSERELEVMQLLTTHLTSSEIADELFIAASTVRSHIKNIYGKLGVHSRTDAVQRAKELALL